MAAFNGEGIRKQLAQARSALRGPWVSLVGGINPATLLLAFLLSFGLWVFVTVRNNPDTQLTSTRSIEVRNLPAGTVLLSSLPSVDITVVGPQGLLEAPNRPLNVWIDLSEQTSGRASVRVETPPGVRAVRVSPEDIPVSVEPLVRADFAVVMNLTTIVPAGVRIDQPVIEPRSVTVSGAKSTVADIVRVVVRPELGGDASDLTRVTRPIPLNAAGQEVSGPRLEISPTTIKVTLPAQTVTGRKPVPIKPIIQGQPLTGYKLDSIKTTPQVVTVAGDADALQSLTVLETEVIDITNRQQTLDRTVVLRVPAGVSAEQTTVQVEVAISAIQARQTLTLPAVVRGLGAGLRAQIVPDNVAVTLEGPVPRIRDLDVGALRVEVNVQGLGPGTHQVQPEIAGPGLDGLARKEMQPARVTVQIAAEPTPTVAPTVTPTALPPSPTPTPTK